MKEFMRKKMWIILASFVLMSLCLGTQTSLADGFMSVAGIVRSVDSNTGIISLDVTSEGCRGLGSFKMPDNAKDDLSESLIGKKRMFLIDSPRCERGKIHNIVLKEQP